MICYLRCAISLRFCSHFLEEFQLRWNEEAEEEEEEEEKRWNEEHSSEQLYQHPRIVQFDFIWALSRENGENIPCVYGSATISNGQSKLRQRHKNEESKNKKICIKC